MLGLGLAVCIVGPHMNEFYAWIVGFAMAYIFFSVREYFNYWKEDGRWDKDTQTRSAKDDWQNRRKVLIHTHRGGKSNVKRTLPGQDRGEPGSTPDLPGA
jgi:hypothetical protein